MPFRLLDAFREIFEGKIYRHRASTQGDRLARFFYEDLYSLSRSSVFNARIDRAESVVNVSNVVTGRRGRRGDGTFGELLPTAEPIHQSGFAVAAGPTANIQIGVEVKILSTAMIKQIDRVVTDLKAQAS